MGTHRRNRCTCAPLVLRTVAVCGTAGADRGPQAQRLYTTIVLVPGMSIKKLYKKGKGNKSYSQRVFTRVLVLTSTSGLKRIILPMACQGPSAPGLEL